MWQILGIVHNNIPSFFVQVLWIFWLWNILTVDPKLLKAAWYALHKSKHLYQLQSVSLSFHEDDNDNYVATANDDKENISKYSIFFIKYWSSINHLLDSEILSLFLVLSFSLMILISMMKRIYPTIAARLIEYWS